MAIVQTVFTSGKLKRIKCHDLKIPPIPPGGLIGINPNRHRIKRIRTISKIPHCHYHIYLIVFWMIGKFRKSPIHIFALMINLNGHSNLKIHSLINNRCMILLIYGYSPIKQNHRHKPPTNKKA